MKANALDIVKDRDLSGKVFLVTGAYSGLGAVTTQALLRANATVIVAGRNARQQSDFAEGLRENDGKQQIDASHTLDLGDLASVKAFADSVKKSYKQIDCLVNNAGVMFTRPGKTKDGFETQMGINVIGHFLLSKLLIGITKRQVWLSSSGHTRLGAPRINLDEITIVDQSTYNTRLRYQQSKLGDILLAKQFGREYPGLVAISVHPGVVRTNLSRNIGFLQKLLFMILHPLMVMKMQGPEEGAATQVMAATLPEAELVNGAYYADCKVAQEADSARNMEDAKRLFDYCNQVTADFQS